MLDRLTRADHSHVFSLPRPALREFALQVCEFDLVDDGAWRARRMIECIRDIRAQFESGVVPAENVFFEIYSALTEGLDNVISPLPLDEMYTLFAVAADGADMAPEVLIERMRVLTEWLDDVRSTAAASDTSCELLAMEMLRKGGPFPSPAVISESSASGESSQT